MRKGMWMLMEARLPALPHCYCTDRRSIWSLDSTNSILVDKEDPIRKTVEDNSLIILLIPDAMLGSKLTHSFPFA